MGNTHRSMAIQQHPSILVVVIKQAVNHSAVFLGNHPASTKRLVMIKRQSYLQLRVDKIHNVGDGIQVLHIGLVRLDLDPKLFFEKGH